MLREDYLLKLIKRAGEALARALGLIDEEKLKEAEAEAQEALRKLAKLPLDTITTIDVATLRPLIGDGTPQGVRLVARALWMLGDIDTRQGNADRARARHVRAMQLYKDVGLGDDPADQRAARELAQRYAKK